MRILILILFTTLSNYSFSQTNNLNDSNILDSNPVGEWIIDLRPTQDASPYLQTLVISTITEQNITGSFYGSSIQDAFINDSWDKLYFAFKTSDNSNNYYQSGYILGDEIFGITYCPERKFAMPWTGKKKVK